jgi:uncharacterized oxidoreductase
MTRRIPRDVLEEFVDQLLQSLGAPRPQAETVTSHLVRADLRGHGSHGVRLLPTYAAKIEEGQIVPDATPSITEASTVLQAVGDGAFGQYTGAEATETAIERAAEVGWAFVGIRDGGHLGRIGEYAEQAAEAGFLFAALVNGPRERPVAPAGSDRIRLCTNPIAFGVPTFDALPYPVVLDIATSQVALGKIKRRRAAGVSMPSEWAITPDGEPITDPEKFYEDDGRLLPVGGRSTGHKGYGLAVVAELFATVVGGGPVLGNREENWGNGAAFVVLDPTLVTSRCDVRRRVTTLAEHLKEGGEDVLLPGEPEHRTASRNLERGVPLPDADARALRETALKNGVASSEIPEDHLVG